MRNAARRVFSAGAWGLGAAYILCFPKHAQTSTRRTPRCSGAGPRSPSLTDDAKPRAQGDQTRGLQRARNGRASAAHGSTRPPARLTTKWSLPRRAFKTWLANVAPLLGEPGGGRRARTRRDLFYLGCGPRAARRDSRVPHWRPVSNKIAPKPPTRIRTTPTARMPTAKSADRMLIAKPSPATKPDSEWR
jgi:hypothetical protein